MESECGGTMYQGLLKRVGAGLKDVKSLKQQKSGMKCTWQTYNENRAREKGRDRTNAFRNDKRSGGVGAQASSTFEALPNLE